MIDFSPTNAQSLVMVKDLDSQEVKDKILALALDIRNLGIKLELAEAAYFELFGKKYYNRRWNI